MIPKVSRTHWFTVDAEGFRQLQVGREPWKLVKELVANAWDEPITRCELSVEPHRDDPDNLTYLACKDDSRLGFADLQSARTFFRRTSKRRNPAARGRFNLGEKEILSVARWARIVTTSGTLVFDGDGHVKSDPESKTDRGTTIELVIPWGEAERQEIVTKLRSFLPPRLKALSVNGEPVPHRKPGHEIKCSLETVLEDESGLRPTTRRTRVHVHKATGAGGCVYELGVPVVELADCPYLIDVQQKVPVSPNRDTLRPAYLKDLLAEVLNHVAEDLTEENVSATWVRAASEDERASNETLKTVQRKRWGDKVALWSSDPHANERAVARGYALVHARTLSPEERRRFVKDVGIRHASSLFPEQLREAKPIPQDKWTASMRAIAGIFRRVGGKLLAQSVEIRWIHEFKMAHSASYGNGTLALNKAHLAGWHRDSRLRAEHLKVLVHELAHEGPIGELEHAPEFRRRLERLAGELAMLALEEPAMFSWSD